MKRITTQLRLILAETLLGWILSIAPRDHPDGKRLVVAIADYLRQQEQVRARDDLERRMKWDPWGTMVDFNRLEELVAEMRRIAEPVGPMHSFWDDIFEAEAVLDEKPTIDMPIGERIARIEALLRR
jgi:hypothetical protein